tara:strand:- start:257 stop:745 length:489 start_codon:yes stop_codon:yes gene_type:complete
MQKKPAEVASRIMFAPEEAVYAALTDPEQLAVWLAPQDAVARFESFDMRPGGTFRLAVTHHDDRVDIFTGRFVDIIWEQQIVHLLEYAPAGARMSGHMRVAWTVEDQAAGTCVRVGVRRVPSGMDRAELMKQLDAMLERLSFLVERLPSASIIFSEAGARSC